MYRDRLKQIVEQAVKSLYEKINGGALTVDNEASLQLQFSAILKTLGDLYVYRKEERFSIELEKSVRLSRGKFLKSDSPKAKIDVVITMESLTSDFSQSCAIELKYFKKALQREPNNRYDVFLDMSNLELYGEFVECGYLLVATDHEHYISKTSYSEKTAAFDLRDGEVYRAGTPLEYNTDAATKPKKYENTITLANDYEFSWETAENGIGFMCIEVNPT